MEKIETTLRQFITDNFLFGQDDVDLKNHDSFLEKGIIDSTGVLELVSFLEEEYGFEIADEELIPNNLDSIDHLTKFILSKSQSQSS